MTELADLTRFPADGLDRYPHQLSGGQRQRVGLMRALMLDPDALLLDEPLGALDPLVRADLQADLRDIFRPLGKTVVLVTHDLGEAAFFADRVVLLRDGPDRAGGQPGRPVAPPGRPVRHPVRPGPARPGGAGMRRPRPDSRVAAPLAAVVAGCSRRAAPAKPAGRDRVEEVHRVGDPRRDGAPSSPAHAGAEARRDDLGGTPALWLALTQGDIDAYPEYTGTITRQILKADPPDLAAALAAHGVRMSRPLGFRNNYALGMRKDVAAAKGIRRFPTSASHPELRLGFIHEFLDRPDGWPGVKRHYDLPQTNVQGMNHTLAYRALVEKAIDVTELYTTDGEIAQYDLLVLDDDRDFFPAYEAVWLYRADLADAPPGGGRATPPARRPHLRGRDAADERRGAGGARGARAQVAAEFLRSRARARRPSRPTARSPGGCSTTTGEHLLLVVPSLLAAVLVAVPLGVLAARRPRLGRVILAATGVLQTIPSLALLLFMIPVMMWLVGQGTGAPPAIAALFLYSLLPIVRNTHAGLTGIPASLRESAEALGLPPLGDPVADRAAAGRSDDPGRHQDGGGDQRRHRDARRVHRRRRLRPPDPPRHRQVRRAAHARRGDPGGAAGPGDRGLVRADRASRPAPRLILNVRRSEVRRHLPLSTRHST